jgi:hypothetical protein
MDNMVFEQGQRVVYTDNNGTTHRGVVEVQRRGWVMIGLDEPCDTTQGWKASRMMLKSSAVAVEDAKEVGDGEEVQA